MVMFIIVFLFFPQIIVILIVIKLKNPITTNYYFYITLQKFITRSTRNIFQD
jgi:hypothetical protein